MMNSIQEAAGCQDTMQAVNNQPRDFRSHMGSVSRTFHVNSENRDCQQGTMTWLRLYAHELESIDFMSGKIGVLIYFNSESKG